MILCDIIFIGSNGIIYYTLHICLLNFIGGI